MAAIVDVRRVERALARRPGLARRLFSEAERAYCDGARRPGRHYAARFAARRAFALLAGRRFAFSQVEVARAEDGAVRLVPRAGASEEVRRRCARMHLSLSHDGDLAVAALCEDPCAR